MEFSDILYIGLVSGIISACLTLFVINQMVNGFLENLRDRLDGLIEDDEIVDCYITFTDKIMYMYTREDNQFIAQGSTWEELNDNSRSQYKDVRFNVTTEDIDKAKVFNK